MVKGSERQHRLCTEWQARDRLRKPIDTLLRLLRIVPPVLQRLVAPAIRVLLCRFFLC